MLFFNENYQPIDVDKLKESLKTDQSEDVPTQEEVEKALGDYYTQALQVDTKQYGLPVETAESFNAAFSIWGVGKKILERIREFICAILSVASTVDEIVDAVLAALARIIPGGFILEFIVKRVVKYLISIGIGAFCNVPA